MGKGGGRRRQHKAVSLAVTLARINRIRPQLAKNLMAKAAYFALIYMRMAAARITVTVRGEEEGNSALGFS